MSDWKYLDAALVRLLGLEARPIAISFTDRAPEGVFFHDQSMPRATADGRTGRAEAGCIFWMQATERTITKVA